jgi:hypothetical protein
MRLGVEEDYLGWPRLLWAVVRRYPVSTLLVPLLVCGVTAGMAVWSVLNDENPGVELVAALCAQKCSAEPGASPRRLLPRSANSLAVTRISPPAAGAGSYSIEIPGMSARRSRIPRLVF